MLHYRDSILREYLLLLRLLREALCELVTSLLLPLSPLMLVRVVEFEVACALIFDYLFLYARVTDFFAAFIKCIL